MTLEVLASPLAAVRAQAAPAEGTVEDLSDCLTNVSLLCYNSITEQGQMFCVTFAHREATRSWLWLVSMVSIKPGIRAYGMESDGWWRTG
jgi:hypothetical protein